MQHARQHQSVYAPDVPSAPRASGILILKNPLRCLVLAVLCMMINESKLDASMNRESSVFEVLEWSLENPDWSGNPFDLQATATFTHHDTNRVIRTPLFYDGEDTWRFRFTAPRHGTWTFATTSPHQALDGHKGTVDVTPDPEALGFFTTKETKFARQVGDERILRPSLFNIYTQHCLSGMMGEYPYPYNKYLSDWKDHPGGVAALTRQYAREVKEHGMNALHLQCVANEAFAPGIRSHSKHDKVNPEIETFRILEEILQTTHEEGILVHIWWWGDENRQWTPVGLAGGMNGEADRRLQRTIAARLGPLPGWTMAYGFDLHESDWTGGQPDVVREWHDYLNTHWGWKHLLMAREEARAGFEDTWFRTPDELPVYSTDDLPQTGWEFYEVARERLKGHPLVPRGGPDLRHPRPVLFEKRFLHMRHGFDGPTTRRAIWQFTMAGGAASVWGRMWGEDSLPYDTVTQTQLLTFARFWENRWQFDLQPALELVSSEGTVALANADRSVVVLYAQNAGEVRLSNAFDKGSCTVLAVDTTEAYAETQLGVLAPGENQIELPRRADWAIVLKATE